MLLGAVLFVMLVRPAGLQTSVNLGIKVVAGSRSDGKLGGISEDVKFIPLNRGFGHTSPVRNIHSQGQVTFKFKPFQEEKFYPLGGFESIAGGNRDTYILIFGDGLVSAGASQIKAGAGGFIHSEVAADAVFPL